MKCPKCGYNSFDHLESCKKCGEDMAAHKTRFGLRCLFFGAKGQEAATAHMALGELEDEAPPEAMTATGAPTDFAFMSQDKSEEDPSASSLEDLLDVDRPAEKSEAFQAGDPPDFDFTLEKGASLIESGEDFGEKAVPEAVTFSEFDQDDTAGLESGWEPFDNLDSSAISADSPGRLEEEPAGQDFASMDEPDSWEEAFDEPLEGAANPAGRSGFTTDPGLFSFDGSEESAGAGEGPPGPSKANLAELFLDSLDGFESTEAAPVFSEEEIAFEDISSEVNEVGAEESAGSDSLREREEVEASEELSSPSLVSRVGAGGTDLMILSFIFVLFLVTGEVVLGPDQGGGIFPSSASLLAGAIPYFLVLFAVSFGYFTLFHFLIGQTPGKMLFRIRVVGEDGDGLMFSQAFLRSVGGLLSLLPAGLGYVTIVIDRERRGWNDRLASSRVIPVAGWESLKELSEEERVDEGPFNPCAGA